MSQLKDADIKNMKPGSKSKVESLGKSRGALVFRKVADTTTGYYRYWKGKQSILLKLGVYKATSKSAGFTLAELRKKALDMAATRQQIAPQDLKEYLEQQERDRQQQEKDRRLAIERAEAMGSFEDLLQSYVKNLYRLGRKTAREVETSLTTHVIKAFPELSKRKANDICVDDIVSIIRKMLANGTTTRCNRIRSFIHAAFEFGMKADNDPLHYVEQGKRFHIQFNPASAVPRQSQFERVKERTLTNEELKDFWETIDTWPTGESPLYRLLLKVMVACFGNRPQQLTACSWKDIDFRARTLTFIDSKGKGARPKKRVIPLTNLAIRLFDEISNYSGKNPGPFYIRNVAPISIHRLAGYVSDYNDWLQKKAKDEARPMPEKFTARDLRRTATRLLIDCRIPKEQRFLLQSREDGSIESKHYDHDDRIPEKREAATIYTRHLEKVITGTLPDKLVDLDVYRKKKNQ